MSTILKSLKKLEQEKLGNPSSSLAAGYSGPGSLNVDNQKPWYKTSWFRWSMVAIIIFGLSTSSIYFYQQSRKTDDFQAKLDTSSDDQSKSTFGQTDQRQPPDVSPQTSERVDDAPESEASPSEQAPVEKATARVQKSSPTRSSPSTPPASDSAGDETSPTGRQPPKNNVVEKERPADESRPREPEPVQESPLPDNQQPTENKTVIASSNAVKAPLDSKKEAEATEESPPKESTPSYDDVAVLSDGSLKINAIVWSPVKEDRMTVINSQILHEGDSLEGFTLLAIRPDDVVVKKDGGGKYKVIFGRP